MHSLNFHCFFFYFCFFLQLSFSFIYTIAGSFLCSIWISNNRPSTAPRGLQHAILKISISAELFRETLKSVCASGNRHEPSASERGKPRGDVGDGERDGGEGEDKGNKEKIDQKLNKTEFNITVHDNISMCCTCYTFPASSESETTSREGVSRGDSSAAGKLDSSSVCLTATQRFKHADTQAVFWSTSPNDRLAATLFDSLFFFVSLVCREESWNYSVNLLMMLKKKLV